MSSATAPRRSSSTESGDEVLSRDLRALAAAASRAQPPQSQCDALSQNTPLQIALVVIAALSALTLTLGCNQVSIKDCNAMTYTFAGLFASCIAAFVALRCYSCYAAEVAQIAAEQNAARALAEQNTAGTNTN